MEAHIVVLFNILPCLLRHLSHCAMRFSTSLYWKSGLNPNSQPHTFTISGECYGETVESPLQISRTPDTVCVVTHCTTVPLVTLLHTHTHTRVGGCSIVTRRFWSTHRIAQTWSCLTSIYMGFLKQHVYRRNYDTDANVYCKVHGWLSGLSSDFYCRGMNNLSSQWAKCLKRQGDYVENSTDMFWDNCCSSTKKSSNNKLCYLTFQTLLIWCHILFAGYVSYSIDCRGYVALNEIWYCAVYWRRWNGGVVVACFEVLSLHWPGKTENEKTLSW
jgi:hypothetical protein